MREDFKYPYRVITRAEEIEGNQAIGFFIDTILYKIFVDFCVTYCIST
jgi:hypothetical protein